MRWWWWCLMCTIEETVSTVLAAGLLKFDPHKALSLVTTFSMPEGRLNLVDVTLQPHILQQSSWIAG